MPYITSYNPLPISFERGKGVWLYDKNKQAYLDAFSGIAVCGLGHSHPRIIAAINDQAKKLIHISNAFVILEQQKLAQTLINLTGHEQIFFGNSGAEANEAAIKLTRLFAHKKNIKNPQIIIMENSFHGRSMATLSASDKKSVEFEPLLPGFSKVKFNDFAAIEKVIASNKNIVAIMLEPIQGEGGINIASKEYLEFLAQKCLENDYLLIFDEIQTGVARTNNLYSYQAYDFKPDILTTAKGLGNGIPISACIMGQRASNLFTPGSHGSTFGGNPFACRVALEVLDIIKTENIISLVARNSHYLKQQLEQRLKKFSAIKEIRARGYMIGIDLGVSALSCRTIGLKHGILLNVTANTVVRLLPPLIITKAEIDILLVRLEATLSEFFK